MSYQTRSNTRIEQEKRREYGTPKKTEFFKAWDARQPGEGVGTIAKQERVSRTAGQRWLKERGLYGDIAKRKSRRYAQKLGPKPKVPPTLAKDLVNPKTNPVRDKTYGTMATHFEINAHPRTIERSVKSNTKNARRYKQAYRKKEISKKNRDKRTEYGFEHRQKKLPDFWTTIVFTDEAHLDPTSYLQGYILRE
ncbi:hypothetical protein GLAREA_05211 [Glarea lozoyensis ATCC 20868]|uniref:Uncharacterized protein n=1 Tax=Glarea lozoyensis (strain ATCC 20868 / MF5171) TaxID=1116229 RepID=S3EC47_GLAL2|nr:uncharacterized protein GLAREA_05211 [Glarea lozoyensis ATCC 20868]EPE35873.1 hypothetical protein GLAREA_05211 [Glarea lozoyensis ATCC 20868]